MELRARREEKMYETTPEEAMDIASRFSAEIIKEIGPLIKAVVWFGSVVRRPFIDGKKDMRDETLFGSDIDVLLVFDDQVTMLTPEMITAYRIVVEKTASKVSRRLHITTLQITKFWDYAAKGDPILINMLRDGTPVFDTGCFGIAKQLLKSKMIRPSPETVWSYLLKAPVSFASAGVNMRQATLSLYWSVMDAAHAALLQRGITPDSPDELVEKFRFHIVDQNLLDKKHMSTLAEFHNLGTMLMRNELTKVNGDHYDRYRAEAFQFFNAVSDMIVRLKRA